MVCDLFAVEQYFMFMWVQIIAAAAVTDTTTTTTTYNIIISLGKGPVINNAFNHCVWICFDSK